MNHPQRCSRSSGTSSSLSSDEISSTTAAAAVSPQLFRRFFRPAGAAAGDRKPSQASQDSAVALFCNVQALQAQPPPPPSRQRDCHFTDTPLFIPIETPTKCRGGCSRITVSPTATTTAVAAAMPTAAATAAAATPALPSNQWCRYLRCGLCSLGGSRGLHREAGSTFERQETQPEVIRAIMLEDSPYVPRGSDASGSRRGGITLATHCIPLGQGCLPLNVRRSFAIHHHGATANNFAGVMHSGGASR